MKDAHARGAPHGDIKSENVLVTSYNWIYITDFASSKPTYLPEDDPSDFALFFDSSGRRTCYIAPSVFTQQDLTFQLKKQKENVRFSGILMSRRRMDVFSMGCVIAELFTEGTPTFTLAQLYKYRDKEINAETHLAGLEDPGVKALVLSMIALDPEARPSFAIALETYRGSVFPESFYSFLHEYVAGKCTPRPWFGATPTVPTTTGVETTSYESALPNESDSRIDQLWNEFAMLEPHLIAERTNEESEKRPDKVVLELVPPSGNCVIPSSKLRGLDLLLALSVHLTDEAKLDRLIPYVIDLLHDEAAVVRSAAIRTMTQVLMLVTVITPSNTSIFPEYIFPNIRHLAVDSEESVRCTFAQCIAPLADAASSDIQDTDETAFEMPYEASLQDLHSAVQDVLTTALVDSASTVKRAVLHNISSLCVFFGRQKTNDVLLSHMITYLNGRDWLLRYAFFDSIVGVAACVGARSLEEYILPLMIQALSDVEETVVYKVLSSLTSLSELGLFQKMRIWELLSATVPFLYHPSIWVRQGAIAFIASSTKLLPPTDVWCILYPGLRQALRADVRAITEQSLLSTLKPSIFEAAISWAIKSDKSAFWRGQTSKLKSNKESPKDLVSNMRNSADEAQIVKLQQLGMTSIEEAKLVALRDYILKLANTIKSFTARDKDESEVVNFFVGTRATISETPSVYAPIGTPGRKSTLDVTRGPIPFILEASIGQGQIPAHGRPIRSVSVLSGAQDNDMRRRHLRQLVQDGERTAPASIVSTRTVATGTLEAPLKSSDISASGRTSPASTVRGEQRPKLRSAGPSGLAFGRSNALATYGWTLFAKVYKTSTQSFISAHSTPQRTQGTQASRENGSRRADALLISHMNAHDSRVNGIAVSPDHVFFISCSEDRTVKVWDTARLERNVTTKPRHVYTQHHAPVTCVCIIEGTIVLQAPEGWESPRCESSYGSPALLYTTNLSSIVALDLRTMRVLRVLESPRHFGPITCACLDKRQSWLVTGTTSGVLTLWDLRFGLLLRSWTTSNAADGSRRGIHQIVSYPSKSRTRHVIVRVETTNTNAPRTASERLKGTVTLEVWDIEKATLEETFSIADTHDTSGQNSQPPEPCTPTKEGRSASTDAASAIAELIRSRRTERRRRKGPKKSLIRCPLISLWIQTPQYMHGCDLTCALCWHCLTTTHSLKLAW
ncbi:Protein kinase domain [Rhizoctonia solani]|uniref:non-specific serine/threonine protein kinase n=1 Tax=Rhizoctonia solani TaxID=456999 RepID=A0A8H7I6F3_9AGAM|nr:Protein kinase domain [Rhizoctonia solani]